MSWGLAQLTMVEEGGRHCSRLLYGTPVILRGNPAPDEELQSYFAPGQIFAIETWGDLPSEIHLYVLQALPPGVPGRGVPHVFPKVAVCMHAQGGAQVQKAHSWLRSLTIGNRDLAAVTPGVYLTQQKRLERS